MNWAGAVFGLSAAVALLGAVLAVGLRNIFHNILGFALAILGVSGVLLSLGHDVLAIVFVLIYIGALAVAMVYAVMLSHSLGGGRTPRRRAKILGAAAFAATATAAIWLVVRNAEWSPAGGRRELEAAWAGYRFLTDYVLVFELISVLLVVAMVGAVMVARRARPGKEG